jgi:hypothetical protein
MQFIMLEKKWKKIPIWNKMVKIDKTYKNFFQIENCNFFWPCDNGSKFDHLWSRKLLTNFDLNYLKKSIWKNMENFDKTHKDLFNKKLYIF